jgi:hypothetical protein
MASSISQAELAHEFLVDNLALLSASGATTERVTHSRAALLEVRASDPARVRHGGHWLGGRTDDAAIVRECPPGSRTAVVVFGLGTGDTVRAVRASTDAEVIVYEPEPGVARAVLEQGPSDLGDVILACTLHDVLENWAGAAQGEAGAVIVSTPGYREAFPDEHQKLENLVADLVKRTEINNVTHRMRARTWIEDLLANVELLQGSVPFLALRDTLTQTPAFIVGAGPSLGGNGALLGEAAEKGLVIAVNSSARALAVRNVVPQVLCCIESIDVSHLIRPLPFIDHVVRAFSLSAHPRTLRTGRGPLLPIWEAVPEIAGPLAQLTGLPGLAVSGSVSTIAVSLALALGCSPIVLVGQDLAYTGMRAYADGTAYEASRVRADGDGRLRLDWCDTVRATRAISNLPIHESEPLELVTAWGGEGTVPSGPSFAGPRAWLAAAAEALRRAGAPVELVNATEGGSRIEGWREMRLAEVLAARPPIGLTSAELARRASERGQKLRASDLARWARTEMAKVERVMRAARETGRRAERAQRAISAGCPRRVSRAFTALGASERLLREAVSKAPSVDAWSFAALDAVLARPATDVADSREAARQGVQRELELARVIESSARELCTAFRPLAVAGRRSKACQQGERSPCPS